MADEEKGETTVTNKPKHNAASRKKLSLAMKRRWREYRKLGTRPNGPKKKEPTVPKKKKPTVTHATNGSNGHAPTLAKLTYASNKNLLAKAGVRQLAIIGARLRLEQLDRERQVLQMFIRGTK